MSSGKSRVIYDRQYQDHAARLLQYLDTIRPYIGYGFSHGAMRLPVVLHSQNFGSNGLVMMTPRRMELMTPPSVNTFAEPWMKQLATHESRHAVQFNNLNRGFIRVLRYGLGEQGILVGGLLMPMWLMEGDAVMAETQMANYGRGLQPSFSIEYRAAGESMFSGGKIKVDKWFSGSYKNYIPSHYQLGYQLNSWAYTHYNEFIWDKLTSFETKHAYYIFPFSIGLRKLYKTSEPDLFYNTFSDLQNYWASLPQVEDSSTKIATPTTSYTTYSSPMWLGDGKIISLKKDLDRYSRMVEVDTQTGTEKTLFHTGSVHTMPTLGFNGVAYWSELRSSTLWTQRVNSQLCYYDTNSGQRGVVRGERQALFPVLLPWGGVAVAQYHYSGRFEIRQIDNPHANKPTSVTLCSLPDTVSVHGLAWDDATTALYFIGLSDSGMWIGTVEGDSFRIIKPASFATIGGLRASGGRLYFNSIASGKDEVHVWDLATRSEYQISSSNYGSFDPAPMGDGQVVMTTYDSDGYHLAVHTVKDDSLTPVPYSRLPKNVVNPPRKKWDVINIDSVVVSPKITAPSKPYRRGLNLFNVHSWMPLSFDPDAIVGERALSLHAGATIISQNLLNTAVSHLSYGWTSQGSLVKGRFSYMGWAPKFEIFSEYGGGKQGWRTPEGFTIGSELALPRRREYFSLGGRVYLPMVVRSGYRTGQIQPSVSFAYDNDFVYQPSTNSFTKRYYQMVGALQYTENVRMVARDIIPRWGYALRATSVGNPLSADYSNLWAGYARAYLPGITLHHGVMLRAGVQQQSAKPYLFKYKELFPRGADYEFRARNYYAGSVDYFLPLCYPDTGVSGLFFVKRIRLGLGADAARYTSFGEGTTRNLTSYGGEIAFDFTVFRAASITQTTIKFSLFKPSDRSGPVFGFDFVLPL